MAITAVRAVKRWGGRCGAAEGLSGEFELRGPFESLLERNTNDEFDGIVVGARIVEMDALRESIRKCVRGPTRIAQGRRQPNPMGARFYTSPCGDPIV